MLRELSSFRPKRRPSRSNANPSTAASTDTGTGAGTGNTPRPTSSSSSSSLNPSSLTPKSSYLPRQLANNNGSSPTSPSSTSPSVNASATDDTSPSPSPQKQLSRGLGAFPRRRSGRGPGTFQIGNSFLSRHRSSGQQQQNQSSSSSNILNRSPDAPSPPTRPPSRPLTRPPLSSGLASLRSDRRQHHQQQKNQYSTEEPTVSSSPAPPKSSHRPIVSEPPSPPATDVEPNQSPLKKQVSPSKLLEPSTKPRITKPGVAGPLTTVDELFNWRPTGAAARCVSTVPLSEAAIRRYVRGGVDRSLASSTNLPPVAASRTVTGSPLKRLQPPRLLLCHDFKGGYPEWEANASGVTGEDCPSDSEIWRFNHWAYVDVFVYFSHHCITIPPVGYIHAAHRHGALVLGTVIFEWDEGTVQLNKILASFKTRAKAAGQLASIAKFFGFDGWLLNVEVNLSAGSTAASDLSAFAGDLTRATRKVLGPASEVIWYDSVTRYGTLSWQNELNENNEQFFKSSSAMFTNYHWDRNAPVRSAVKAGTRRTDVFTGIDVHGRNTFGGGGFHTHIALRAIKQGGTSAAIFAPAWTVEKCPPNVPDPVQMEERFWTGPSGRFGRECVAQYFRERPVVTELPFDTNFDPGWGPKLMRNGNVKDPRKYFNLSQQQIQPSFMRTVFAGGDTTVAELSLSTECVYNGSAAVKLLFVFSDSRMMSGSFSIMRLIIANAPFSPRAQAPIPSLNPNYSPSTTSSTRTSVPSPQKPNEGVKVTYHYYAECQSGAELAANDFGVVLMFGSPAGAVLLVGQNSKWNMDYRARRSLPRLQILGKYVDMVVVLANSDRRAFGAPVVHKKEGNVDSKKPSKSGWMTRTFILNRSLVSSQRLTEIMVIVGGPQEQPLSMRPSPAMSPSNSMRPSRIGSRIGSRVGSRHASRSTSRAGSPPRNGGDASRRRGGGGDDGGGDGDIPIMEDVRMDMRGIGGGNAGPENHYQFRDGTDTFGSNLLNKYRESVGGDSRRRTRGNVTSSKSMSSSRKVSDLGHNDGDGNGSDGHISFEAMQMEEDVSQNASMTMTRFNSRFDNVTGLGSNNRNSSRMGSLAGSRMGSLAGSRMGSLAGSRAGSMVVSPSRTPANGGGGARPLRSSGLRSGMMTPTGMPSGMYGGGSEMLTPTYSGGGLLSGRDSGTATPSGRGSEAITELKSALMTAAGTMAGAGEDERGGAAGKVGGRRTGVTKIVYLGGISIEEIGADGEVFGSERFGNTSIAHMLSAASIHS